MEASRPIARALAVTVRPMTAADWPGVATIYEEGIAAADATFETSVPPWDRWDADHLQQHRLVAEIESGAVRGWAALSPVSDRCAYQGVAEASVYVAAAARGRGIGRVLLGALLRSADAGNLWTVQAGIFPENAASVRLHLACGFRIVGTRERIGNQNGRWRDVLLLERRKA